MKQDKPEPKPFIYFFFFSKTSPLLIFPSFSLKLIHLCLVMAPSFDHLREFVLQSRYYVHFRANTLGKGMNPLILPPAMGK